MRCCFPAALLPSFTYVHLNLLFSAEILGSPAIVFNFVFLGGGLLGRGVNKFLYSLYYCIVNKDEVVWERQEMIIKYSTVKIR